MTDRRTVVLLHGVQSSVLTWWRVESDLIDLGWTALALDLLGHGERPAPAGPRLTIDALARDVLDRLPAGGVDLVVGHSLGAVVALSLAGLAPGCTRALVLEDPPGLAGPLDASQVAADVDQSVRAARDDPAGSAAGLLADNPAWSPTDADHAVRSRVRLDVAPVTEMLRTDPWDLQALVAACPVPLRVLAATRDTALVDPDRVVLSRRLGPDFVEVRSGHSIHRDRPALWLHHVLGFADAVAPAGQPNVIP